MNGNCKTDGVAVKRRSFAQERRGWCALSICQFCRRSFDTTEKFGTMEGLIV